MTMLAFLVTLGIVVTIHEWGHFIAARLSGIKVLRFSVGFGKPILRYTSKKTATEYTLAWLPLGGYVRMLDEREGNVPENERHLAFNTQPLYKRAIVVLAGPLANLILAIALYAGLAWHGTQELSPIIAQPPANSLAAKAGLQSRDTVVSIRRAGAEQAEAIPSLARLQLLVLQAATDHAVIELEVRRAGQSQTQSYKLSFQDFVLDDPRADLVNKIGLFQPWMAPVVGQVLDGQPAQQAGVRSGDVVQSIDGKATPDALTLRTQIRNATPEQAQNWQILREGQPHNLTVTPMRFQEGEAVVAHIGAELGQAPATVTIARNAWQSLGYGLEQTYSMARFSLQMLGTMLIGQASLKNLSGPVSIAEMAGKTAQIGLISYLGFLALISISIGILNLLPIPVLDGGHLMYYLWEFFTGKPVAEAVTMRLQQVGMVLLFGLMSVAFFNDLSRMFGLH